MASRIENFHPEMDGWCHLVAGVLAIRPYGVPHRIMDVDRIHYAVLQRKIFFNRRGARSEAIPQFADWLDTPELKSQRLRDNPNDHLVKFYYHWIRGAVDFINLDNATEDEFDDAQMEWLAGQLDRDSKNPEIRSVVVGMHEALPDSVSAGHSMNESARGTESGRKIYQELVAFRKPTHKNIYVLASHSHFFMDNVYNTACHRAHPEEILPGWIVGTAGAVRYRLPADVSGSTQHMTDVYGYLLGTVLADGSIRFEFKKIEESDVTEGTRKDYTDDFIHGCFVGNTSTLCPRRTHVSGEVENDRLRAVICNS